MKESNKLLKYGAMPNTSKIILAELHTIWLESYRRSTCTIIFLWQPNTSQRNVDDLTESILKGIVT